jgi:alkylation response protein AidB-like acyl-CoA dehydrogenase
MSQGAAVEVRPLREMTGHALFNEVFLTEARVAADALIGELNGGWAVANATLGFERNSLGAGGGSAAVSDAAPGSIAGDLDRRAGDFLGRSATTARSLRGASPHTLIELAADHGMAGDATLRQDIMRLYTMTEIGRYSTLRAKATFLAGRGELPGFGNCAKLSMSAIARLTREVALRILGAAGTLHAYTPAQEVALDAATGQPFNRAIVEMALASPGPSIYGGTDQVQRNIIGERVLGLPKEPNNDKTMPFRDLPRNT